MSANGHDHSLPKRQAQGPPPPIAPDRPRQQQPSLPAVKDTWLPRQINAGPATISRTLHKDETPGSRVHPFVVFTIDAQLQSGRRQSRTYICPADQALELAERIVKAAEVAAQDAAGRNAAEFSAHLLHQDDTPDA